MRRCLYQRPLNSTQASEMIDARRNFAREIKGTGLIQARPSGSKFQGVIKKSCEQRITKIQSHRVSWTLKSEKWSSVRVGYRKCSQKQLRASWAANCGQAKRTSCEQPLREGFFGKLWRTFFWAAQRELLVTQGHRGIDAGPRRAGTPHAASATSINNSTTPTNVAGSLGRTP